MIAFIRDTVTFAVTLLVTLKLLISKARDAVTYITRVYACAHAHARTYIYIFNVTCVTYVMDIENLLINKNIFRDSSRDVTFSSVTRIWSASVMAVG